MKKNIAVLMGGRSLEREFSIKSGERVSNALRKLGHKVIKLDVDESIVKNLKAEKIDLAYIALHPNILSFDKIISKQIFISQGIPTPPFYFLNTSSFRELGSSKLLPFIIEKIGLPLVVKPSAQGSALGIRVVNDKESLPEAIIYALSYSKKVILEKFIDGIELAVSIIGKEKLRTLPIVEIVPKKKFFDFESRSRIGETDYFVPARISSTEEKKVKETAIAVHNSLKCAKLSRVDIILEKKDKVPYVLELNTSPGMTDTSLLPMAAEEAGMSFEELVDEIVGMSLED